MDILKWIQQWYVAHCDGDWEHEYGIAIETLDNPGRSVKISVDNTDLKDKPLENIIIDRNQTDWVNCRIYYDEEMERHYVYGYGGQRI